MPTPRETVWERDPHTAAKHEIIKRYLRAWLPILLNTRDTITYAEGFSGPGVYKHGEPGSPVIAYVEALRDLAPRDGKRVQFALVEGSAKRLAILKEQLEKVGAPRPSAPVDYRRGTCAAALMPLLEKVGAFDAPIFALLDSWGSPVIPHEIPTRLAANPSSEVLITFQPQFLARFGKNTRLRAAGDRAFGSTAWQQVAALPRERKFAFLVETYRNSIRDAGFAYVLSFELLDEQGHQLHLVFGTNNKVGLERMKDAMWKVDPLQGVRYRDPRDPNQESLEITFEPGTGPLSRLIQRHMAEIGSDCTLEELRDLALFESVYRPPHASKVVRQLIKDRVITRLDSGPLKAASRLRLTPDSPTEPETLF